MSAKVETGFVTNEDAGGHGREYQHLLADRIAEGVERYRRQIELGVAARAGGLGGDR
ncbi:MAG: hypothetical protein R3E53_08590 [Myxococcota bacterium]